MYSLLMLPLVIANTALVVWLARNWYQNRDWVLLVTLIPMIALPYDTGMVALGSVGYVLRLAREPSPDRLGQGFS